MISVSKRVDPTMLNPFTNILNRLISTSKSIYPNTIGLLLTFYIVRASTLSQSENVYRLFLSLPYLTAISRQTPNLPLKSNGGLPSRFEYG